MKLVLIVRNFSGRNLKKINLECDKTYVLGRSTDNDIVIRGELIKDRHLEIRVDYDSIKIRAISASARTKIVSLVDGAHLLGIQDGEWTIFPDRLQKINVGEDYFLHLERVPERGKKTMLLSSPIEISKTRVSTPRWERTPTRVGRALFTKFWS